MEGVLDFIEEAYAKDIPMTVATSTDRPMIEACISQIEPAQIF